MCECRHVGMCTSCLVVPLEARVGIGSHETVLMGTVPNHLIQVLRNKAGSSKKKKKNSKYSEPPPWHTHLSFRITLFYYLFIFNFYLFFCNVIHPDYNFPTPSPPLSPRPTHSPARYPPEKRSRPPKDISWIWHNNKTRHKPTHQGWVKQFNKQRSVLKASKRVKPTTII